MRKNSRPSSILPYGEGSEGSERRLASAPPLWWISPTESKGRTENPSRSDGVPALHTFLAIARKTCSSAACCRQWTPPRGAAPPGCEGHRSRGRQFFFYLDDLDGPVSIGLSWSRIRYALRAAERTRTSLSFERAPKSHRGAFAPSLSHYNGTLSAISYLCLSTLRG